MEGEELAKHKQLAEDHNKGVRLMWKIKLLGILETARKIDRIQYHLNWEKGDLTVEEQIEKYGWPWSRKLVFWAEQLQESIANDDSPPSVARSVALAEPVPNWKNIDEFIERELRQETEKPLLH